MVALRAAGGRLPLRGCACLPPREPSCSPHVRPVGRTDAGPPMTGRAALDPAAMNGCEAALSLYGLCSNPLGERSPSTHDDSTSNLSCGAVPCPRVGGAPPYDAHAHTPCIPRGKRPLHAPPVSRRRLPRRPRLRRHPGVPYRARRRQRHDEQPVLATSSIRPMSGEQAAPYMGCR